MTGELVPWEEFRPLLERVWRKPDEERESRAGREPWDAVLVFKAIVPGAPYNLSDEALEHEIGDRLAFMSFLGLGLDDRTPDATTIWPYRERLAKAGVVEALFDKFDHFPRARGYRAMGGRIVDAPVVRCRSGATAEGRTRTSRRAVSRTAGRKARPTGWRGRTWTRDGRRRGGRATTAARTMSRWTAATVHDSQVIGDLVDPGNPAVGVWADKAYRSEEIEELLKAMGRKSRIMRKASRSRKLTKREKGGDRAKVRARVERVFGAQANDMGGTLVRGIGIMRARAHIGLRNLAYDMRRLTHLESAAFAKART